MNTIKYQDIVLPIPRSNLLTAFLMGICLPIGLAIPFVARWQLPALVIGLFFILAGVFGLVLAWKMLHTPVLIINKEGIFYLHPLLHSTIKWDEIDAIYCAKARNRAIFAVDLSPDGLVSFFARQGRSLPRHLNNTEPQLALSIPATNLPIPVSQLLT